MRTWTSLLFPLVRETSLYMGKFIIFRRSGDHSGFGQVISSGPRDRLLYSDKFIIFCNLQTNADLDKFIISSSPRDQFVHGQVIFCRSGDQSGFGQVISSGPRDRLLYSDKLIIFCSLQTSANKLVIFCRSRDSPDVDKLNSPRQRDQSRHVRYLEAS